MVISEAWEGSLILIRYQEEQVVRKISRKLSKICIDVHHKGQSNELFIESGEIEISGVIKTVIHHFKV